MAVLDQLLHDLLPEGFQFDVEVELDLLHILSGREDVLQGPVHIRLDFLQILNDLYPIIFLIALIEQFLVDDVWEVEVEVD